MNWTRMHNCHLPYRTLLGIGDSTVTSVLRKFVRISFTLPLIGQHILNPPLCLMQLGGRHHLHRRSYLTRTLDGAYSIFYLFQ